MASAALSTSVATSASMSTPDLVLGILPSESSTRDWHVGVANRRASRKLWLAAAPPHVVLTRFVLPPFLDASAANNKSVKQLRRRRLSGPDNLKQLQQRAHALQREASNNADDMIELPAKSLSSGSACTCAELMQAWFAHALTLWPHAKFIGKAEDDVLVNLPALHWELSRLPYDGGRRLLWWGLMAWTGNGDVEHPRTGCWGGGFEDDPVLHAEAKTLAKERGCPPGATPIAPSPTHEIDVRSSSLARVLAACDYPARWLVSMASAKKCPNDCAAVQGHWLTKCAAASNSPRNVTLAHATWSKVHSNSFDNGWRPFAPPSNLTLVLDMNLGDKKLRELGAGKAWELAASAVRATRASTLPPLLYEYSPSRRAGGLPLLAPLNKRVAALHHETCRWGGCHPSRNDGYIEWPAWRDSAPWPATSEAALGMR